VANEIIVMERGNGAYSFYFFYAIPVASRIEVGGTGTTGQYPVLTPTSGLPDAVNLVLTQGEKDALDAGEAVLLAKNIAIPDGSNDAEVLALARGVYAANAATALADYTRRFKYIGRRFDKE
jgi:hypothetical protein